MTQNRRMSYQTLLLGGALLLSVIIIWAGVNLSWQQGLRDLQSGNRQQLDQFVSHLDARLARFEFLPELIAKNRLLDQFLLQPNDTDQLETVNRFLEDINDIIGASDSYLMDANGLTLAASNWQSDRPFVGKNFSFRPYFSEAMKGRQGRYFALGTTSEKRGYYFSYPVTDTAGQIGVVVVKMDLSNIEQHWSGRDAQFIVSDPDGVVFITTKPEWLFASVKPIDAPTRQRITLSQRYLDIEPRTLPFTVEQAIDETSQMISLKSTDGAGLKYFLTLQREMPEAGWSVTILTPLDDVRNRALMTALILFLVLILLALMTYAVWQRRKRRQERERFQLESQKQLEDQVSLRTADLMREVEEHKRTEQTLRDTQGELIQTAKLAVLGQLSASISHELNNPLAAIRSYADNAREFLARNKPQQVDDNLERIAHLTDQMGKISSQLKFFARKSSGALEPVRITAVIQSAVELMRPQLKRSGVNIDTQVDADDLCVLADPIQLEQVLVNLISNAINAMEDLPNGQINISASAEDDGVTLHVDDSGPGIADGQLDNIFDPFFTTRKAGLGLGLSISERIIDNMQGSLSARNLTDGGARFTIQLLEERAAA